MMTIYSLIDDMGACGEHGLSLLIALSNGQQILFDMGQGERFKQNAEALGMDINAVQLAVISHGHYDHGGGLSTFLTSNNHAPVYIHRRAFEQHYSIREDGKHMIGVECPKDMSRLVLCGDMVRINNQITLFSDVHSKRLMPTDNRRLLGNDGASEDDFGHEMNMIIRDGDISVLVVGCGHKGIVNILERACEIIGNAPTYVVAGMHLKNSTNIAEVAAELATYPSIFYTMHCTGLEAYEQLHTQLEEHIHYLHCGDQIQL